MHRFPVLQQFRVAPAGRWLLAAGLLLLCAPTWAGPPAGFCSGAAPLPADAFEVEPDPDPDPENDDDSLPNGKINEVPTSAQRRHTFHDDPDEDWIRFFGLAMAPSGGSVTYVAEALDLGAGIYIDSTLTEGTGVRLQLFDAAGQPVLNPDDTDPGGNPVPFDTFKPGGQASLIQCDDAGLAGSGVKLTFEVPVDGEYFIRVSQCRNDAEVQPLGLCIPDDAAYDFRLGYGSALDPGRLQGQVTDADTGQPLLFVLIELQSPLNNAAFTQPALSGPPAVPDGSYVLSNTETGDSLGSAAINPAGGYHNPDYETALFEFPLMENMITLCDVSLQPVPDPDHVFGNGFEGVPPPTRDVLGPTLTCTPL